MQKQTKKNMKDAAIVVGMLGGITVGTMTALKINNAYWVNKIALTHSYMIINKVNDLDPKLLEQAVSEITQEIQTWTATVAPEMAKAVSA